MLIVIKKGTTTEDLEKLTHYLNGLKAEYTVWNDPENSYIALQYSLERSIQDQLKQYHFVERILEEKLLQKQTKPTKEIKIKSHIISRNNFTIIAGPCTIDNREDLRQTAQKLRSLGVYFLRGGAYKLRSSPYSYQGLGKEALRYMKEVCDELDMVSVSEITSIDDLKMMSEYIDILIVGTRNMQNYRLLTAIGETDQLVILKRGMANTIKEWILAAEYISKAGNENIILCERGIRTFENYTRNTLDLSAVPIIQSMTPYPVIVDPSHSSGIKELVKPLSWATAAAGADGLLVECHYSPEKALCDAQQTISIENLKEIKDNLSPIINLWNKVIN
ncbi:MAG: 3-deoxy-7-phosphoheptulonate synthase [Candidatus Cloacimonetes bacterium]|nr:3-deoxy-7-phosphoheptulonate synthase [Candidatus Cloacimonadota bacterium]